MACEDSGGSVWRSTASIVSLGPEDGRNDGDPGQYTRFYRRYIIINVLIGLMSHREEGFGKRRQQNCPIPASGTAFWHLDQCNSKSTHIYITFPCPIGSILLVPAAEQQSFDRSSLLQEMVGPPTCSSVSPVTAVLSISPVLSLSALLYSDLFFCENNTRLFQHYFLAIATPCLDCTVRLPLVLLAR